MLSKRERHGGVGEGDEKNLRKDIWTSQQLFFAVDLAPLQVRDRFHGLGSLGTLQRTHGHGLLVPSQGMSWQRNSCQGSVLVYKWCRSSQLSAYQRAHWFGRPRSRTTARPTGTDREKADRSWWVTTHPTFSSWGMLFSTRSYSQTRPVWDCHSTAQLTPSVAPPRARSVNQPVWDVRLEAACQRRSLGGHPNPSHRTATDPFG